MRVDANVHYFNGNQRTKPSTEASTSFSAALTAAQTDNDMTDSSTKQADFTSMTRQEMRDWANTQIRNGEMSLDDGRPFMAMTMKIPVNGGELAGAHSDETRYNFIQKTRDGIQGALSRNDETTLKMLESAMSIMQDKSTGVNIRI